MLRASGFRVVGDDEGSSLAIGHSRYPNFINDGLLRKGLLFRGAAAALAGAVLGIVSSFFNMNFPGIFFSTAPTQMLLLSYFYCTSGVIYFCLQSYMFFSHLGCFNDR